MPIPASCLACGWIGKLKDEFAGKRGKCPACREIIQVPAIESEADYGDYEVVDDDPPPKPALSKRTRDDDDDRASRSRQREDDDDDNDRPRSRRRDNDDERDRPKSRSLVDEKESDRARPRRRDNDDEDDRPRSRRRDDDEDDRRIKPKSKIKKKIKKDESEPPKQLTGTAAMFGGIGMMLGAVVWFILGLVYQDKIYFYPPVLFVLGIGAFIRGMQEESDRH